LKVHSFISNTFTTINNFSLIIQVIAY